MFKQDASSLVNLFFSCKKQDDSTIQAEGDTSMRKGYEGGMLWYDEKYALLYEICTRGR